MLPRPLRPALLRRPTARRRAGAILAVAVTVVLGLQAAGPALAVAAEPAPAATPTPTVARTASTPSPSPSPTSAASTPSPRTSASTRPTAGPSAGPSKGSSADPTPEPSTGSTPTPRASTAVADGPTLTVQPLVNPRVLDRAGRQVTYSVTVTNTGAQAVRDLAVTVVAPDLHALRCAPVAQGATLTPGAGTVCSATRTSLQGDLRSHGGTVSATAAGFAPDGSVVSATAAVHLATTTAPPVVTDDRAEITRGTPSVILPATKNDSPGVAGGPALDPSRTQLKSPYAGGYQYLNAFNATNGTWHVLADGSVEYLSHPGTPSDQAGHADAIQYRTIDSAGQSTLGKLTVVVRDGLRAKADAATTRQGEPVDVNVLANDRPGLKPDGTAGVLDAQSLAFPAAQPDETATLSDDGHTLTTPNVGTFEAYAGSVSFSPQPTFYGTAAATYSAQDSLGNVGTATVTVTVTKVTPTLTDPTAVTPYLTQVDVDWYSHATPGAPGTALSFGGFVSGLGTNYGTQVTTGQGTWYSPVYSETPPHAVSFYPAVGFSGVATVPFQVVDANGTRATATMRVTVRHGWSAKPDTATTTPGTDVTIDPLANDVPNQRADGSPGHFDLRRLAFSDSGQPSGATVASGGKTIMLPGRGSAWITNGKVTFRPQTGFTGFAGRLALDVYDDSSQAIGYPSDVLLDRVGVVVRGNGPAATDDSATTVLGRPVTLPASSDDDPGATTLPLPTTFPGNGQPSGSVVSAAGTVLTVPGEGVWSLNPAGTATFTPESGFVDGTSPVTYRVQGAGGAGATATLSVSVYPGPSATADTVSTVRDEFSRTTFGVLTNDLPGRDADGTLGSIDRTSVRFPLDGQPAGSVVSEDGRLLTVPLAGAPQAYIYFADPDTGQIGLQMNVPRLGTTPRVTYEVQDTVVDAGGATVHRRTTASLQVSYTGKDPVATDDSATTTAGRSVRLPGPLNDVAGSGSLNASFPSDQLAALPPGSIIRLCCSDENVPSWDAIIPGEGDWTIDPYVGEVVFYPAQGFVGTTTPLRYRVNASDGGSADGTLRVTVLGVVPAALRPDTATTPQGVGVAVRPFDNDTAGHLTDGTPVPLDVDALTFSSPPPKGTFPQGTNGKELVVPGEGRYSIAWGTGIVTFRPDPAFRGTTSTVLLTDQGLTSTLQVVVRGVGPVARNDSATTSRGTPVQLRVLADDDAGAPARPLVVGSVRLLATGLPAGASLSSDAMSVTLPGHGTFAVAGDGTITYYPLASTSGDVPPVSYQVADLNGTTVSATVTVHGA